MSSAVLEPATVKYHAGTFLPGDPTASLEDLLEMVWRNRLTTFLAVYAELFSLCPKDCEASGFLAAASEVIDTQTAERRAVAGNPVFQVWVGLAMHDLWARLTGRTDDSQPLRARLEEFPHMLGRVREAIEGRSRPLFHRLDMDPLIAAVLPPSYVVPDDAAERKARSRLGHPLAFFRDVVGIALERIQAAWPEARNYFDRLVYAVCYLPDADFRSCSASRYTGVILISNRDCSVLDLEESLVHEAGHQLLYNVVEADAVTDDSTAEQYRLPWSNQVRDFYGYFHAFYIYVLLAQYHERVIGSRIGTDRAFAEERLRHILRGLVAALPDFQGNPHLTPRGHALAAALAGDVAELALRNDSLVAAGHV